MIRVLPILLTSIKQKLKGQSFTLAIATSVLIATLMVILYILVGFWLKQQAGIESYKKAELLSNEITRKIELYFRDAYIINNTYTGNFLLYKKNKIPRTTVYNFIKGSLNQNSRFLAFWTMCEENAYDNDDKHFANDGLHDTQGHFAIAYYFDNNQIKYEVNSASDFNEDFYTIPAHLKKAVIIDPFHYQYHGNSKVFFETSMINPIMEGDKFLGVIGIDIDLYKLQEQYSRLKVYSTGFVSIVSNSGLIVTHPDNKKVNTNLRESFSEQNKPLLDSFKQGKAFTCYTISEFSNKEVLRLFYPINLEYMAFPWYIMVEIPKEEIFANVNKIQLISFLVLVSLLALLFLMIYSLVQRKHSERNLLKEKLFTEKLLDSLPAIFYMYNAQHVLRRWNRRHETDLGYTGSELFNFPMENWVVQPDLKKRTKEETDWVINNGISVVMQAPLLHKDGTEIPYLLTGECFETPEGTMMMGVGVNISDRIKAENDLKESEAYNKVLFQDSHTPLVVMDSDTMQFIDCNDAAVKIYGFSSRDETIGKGPLDVSTEMQYSGTTYEEAKKRLKQAEAEGSVLFDWRHKRPNGDVWDAEVHLMSFQYKSKLMFQFSLLDITERKRISIELAENQLFIQNITEQSPDIIYVFDIATNKNVYINKNIGALLGFEQGTVIDDSFKLIETMLHPDDESQFSDYQTLVATWQTDYVKEFEYRLKDVNGNWRWFQGKEKAFQLSNNKISSLIGVVRDITNRKEVEIELQKHRDNLEELVRERTSEIESLNEELKQSNEELHCLNEDLVQQKLELNLTLEQVKDMQEQLIQSEKMASIGILTAGVAHEINNPLNFISAGISSLEVLMSEEHMVNIEKEPLVRKVIANMMTGLKRVSDIVSGLNRFSRSANEVKSYCSLHQILNNSLLILNHEMKHRCTVVKKYYDADLIVFGNEGRLNQVFLNILNNASQAIEKIGTITITTQLSKNYAFVYIADSGKGIPKENLKHIFDPFFTTKEPGKGTGLGLSIAFNIIKEHRGIIDVTSEVQKGTTFCISIPLNDGV